VDTSDKKPEVEKIEKILNSFKDCARDENKKRKRFLVIAVICFISALILINTPDKFWPYSVFLQYIAILLLVASIVLGIISSCSEEQTTSVSGFGIASKILFFISIVFCFFGAYFFRFMQAALVCVFAAFVSSMIYHVLLLREHKLGLSCAIGSLIFLGLAAVFFWGFLIQDLSVLFITAAVVLAIIVHIISFRSKEWVNRLWSIAVTFLMSILLLVLVPMTFNSVLPHIYTPPALTLKSIGVYKRCVTFVKDHDEYKNLTWREGILWDGHEWIDTKKVFSMAELVDIKEFSQKLSELGCVKFRRDSDILLFYKMANSIWFIDPGFNKAFSPTSPGVLYSLNDGNPNEVDSEVLNPCKPFVKISGDWYMSRHLMLTGPRLDIQTSTPMSLIDRSLQIKGVDFEITNEKVSQPSTKNE
jgi:energy-coupling factor transporter transmembrane protein EcfT